MSLQVKPGKKEHDVYVNVYEAKDITHLDQTGCFPFKLAREHKYFMVMYEIDGITLMWNH